MLLLPSQPIRKLSFQLLIRSITSKIMSGNDVLCVS
jgi:hypothetical protein